MTSLLCPEDFWPILGVRRPINAPKNQNFCKIQHKSQVFFPSFTKTPKRKKTDNPWLPWYSLRVFGPFLGSAQAHECPKNQIFIKLKIQHQGFCPNFKKILKRKKTDGLWLPWFAAKILGPFWGFCRPVSAPKIRIFKN